MHERSRKAWIAGALAPAVLAGPVWAQAVRPMTDLKASDFRASAMHDTGTEVFVVSSADPFGTNAAHAFQVVRWTSATGAGAALTSGRGISNAMLGVSVSDDGQWVAFLSRDDPTGQNRPARLSCAADSRRSGVSVPNRRLSRYAAGRRALGKGLNGPAGVTEDPLLDHRGTRMPGGPGKNGVHADYPPCPGTDPPTRGTRAAAASPGGLNQGSRRGNLDWADAAPRARLVSAARTWVMVCPRRSVALLAASLLVLPACSSSNGFLPGSEPSTEVRLDEPFRLPVGWTAVLEGENFSLKFLDVLGDSRCPVDVQCVWAGLARISLRPQQKGLPAETLILEIGPEGLPASVGTYGPFRVEFLGLFPPRRSGVPIASETYRAELRISRT